jgi:protein SCO1/2
MEPFLKPSERLFCFFIMQTKYIILISIFVIGVTAGAILLTPKSKVDSLKVFNPTDIDSRLVDSSLLGVGRGHTVQDFSFVNQYGEIITQKNVEGKVYVVDYFFTTCGSICPIMTEQMKRVQAAFLNEPDFLILSHTVWPEVDTIQQLLRYAKEKAIVRNKWHLLTGDKEALYAQARKSYFVLKPAEAEDVGDGNSDFIHTNNFVLIDRKRRIRGYYDGTNPSEVDKLIRDIRLLLKE